MHSWSRSLWGIGEPMYHTSELPAIKMIIRLTPCESAFFGVVILVESCESLFSLPLGLLDYSSVKASFGGVPKLMLWVLMVLPAL